METRLSYTRDELIGRLNTLVGSTESIYLHLGRLYPEIVREMNRSLEESAKAVDSMRQGSTIEAFLHDISGSVRDFVGSLKTTLEEMSGQDSEALRALNTVIGQLSSLDGLVVRIKQDSEEMEIISLNAMTSALKAGNIGKAFSVITDDLKRLSEQTIKLTESLTEDERALLASFYKFKESLESVEKYRQEIIGNLDDRLNESLSIMDEGLSEIANFFSSLVQNSGAVKGPVMSIMEEIQLQDLIRQSVDHVIIALKEIEDPMEGDNSGELLDDWFFEKLLSGLCQSVLADVDSKLAESIGSFGGSIASIDSLITEGERARNDFARDYSRGSATEVSGSSFGARLDHSAKLINGIMVDVGHYFKLKDHVLLQGSALAHSVEDLEDRFRSFSRIVSRFQSINVASRIESAKQQALRGMNETVQEMSSLTERIGGDVSGALESTKSFIDKTRLAVVNLERLYVGERKSVEAAERELSHRFGDVNAIKDSLGRQVEGFSLYTHRFVDLISSSRTDLAGLATLRSEIAAIDQILDTIRQKAVENISLAGIDPESEHQSGKNQRLKELIQRFTILTHKKAAGDLGKFDVESGTASGEVTLF
jgi:hypothetical protein